jgi:2,5-diamino-6-(ribosylamino)-4(3H)-pyrimidinone 5'-phosphate reductase
MHVHVNAATSIDGKLSTRERAQVRISGPADWKRVDQLRADADAVLVGVGTVCADDPSLTADAATADDQPTRVVVDSTGRTPLDAAILNADAPSVVLASGTLPDDRRAAYVDRNATVIERGDDRVDIEAGLDAVADQGVDRVLVEGGGEVIFSLFESGLVDELSVFVGGTILGGRAAPTLADGAGFVESFPDLELTDLDRLDDGVVLHWTVS